MIGFEVLLVIRLQFMLWLNQKANFRFLIKLGLLDAGLSLLKLGELGSEASLCLAEGLGKGGLLDGLRLL